jgi:hypothetical protein
MKKIIIATAIVLSSGVAALCLNKADNKPAVAATRIEKSAIGSEISDRPKADLSSAD